MITYTKKKRTRKETLEVVTITPELVDIESMLGANYNPRKVIGERLDQITKSLKYLGFLSPLYVSTKGIILSGHQRTTAAHRLGYTKVPVVYVEVNDGEEKGLNLHFNRITCDMDRSSLPEEVFDEYTQAVNSIDFDSMSVVEPDTYYPCMDLPVVSSRQYVDSLVYEADLIRQQAVGLLRKGIYIPLVVTEDGKHIINGLSRLFSILHRGYITCGVVKVPKDKERYADLALNFLSMDFDLTTHLKDNLRFNSFRRVSVSTQIIGLSKTFSYFVFGRALKSSQGSLVSKKNGGMGNPDLDLLPHVSNDSNIKFRDTYGQVIVDFGAGTYHDSGIMTESGFTMLSFEPYSLHPENHLPDLEITREKVGGFLNQIKELGTTPIDSIVSSYVLNSIPYHKDRMAYLCIASAMCKVNTTIYIGTQHVNLRKNGAASQQNDPNLEANMTIGKGLKDFKVQKFFHQEELRKMLKVFWIDVPEGIVDGGSIFFKCKKPKRINTKLLLASIELEFNLPHVDGSLDLVNEAVKAFESYTGRQLKK